MLLSSIYESPLVAMGTMSQMFGHGSTPESSTYQTLPSSDHTLPINVLHACFTFYRRTTWYYLVLHGLLSPKLREKGYLKQILNFDLGTRSDAFAKHQQ